MIKTTTRIMIKTKIVAKITTRSQCTRNCPVAGTGGGLALAGRPDVDARDGRGGDVTAMAHPDPTPISRPEFRGVSLTD